MRGPAAAFLLLMLAPTPADAQLQTMIERATRERDNACPAARRDEVQARLEELRAEDQGQRSGDTPWAEVAANDRERRLEVVALFAEGCLSTGRDFHTAALIFQHGVTLEHYYQAYVWASRAVALGDEDARWLIPRAIDRYLMNAGYKQLYATNFVGDTFYSDEGQGANTWCLWPTVESTVNALDEASREAMGVGTLAAQIERAADMNENGVGRVCPLDVPDPPEGIFPGVW